MADVAGMLRSLHYAAWSPLSGTPAVRPEDIPALRPWADFWYGWLAYSFVQSYLATEGIADLLPTEREDLEVLLDAYVLEKVLYEVNYELNNRPAWVDIPLRAALEIVGEPRGGE
jgi:maltose alpha-D-glucosyltransferase/alpha-amylase